jgi:hypothetical protein
MPLTAAEQADLDALEKQYAGGTTPVASSGTSATLSFVPEEVPTSRITSDRLTPAERADMDALERRYAGTSTPEPSPTKEDPGLFSQLKSYLYPTTKEEGINPDYEKLDYWHEMPEMQGAQGMSGFSVPHLKAELGALGSGPDQLGKILQQQVPGTEVWQDGKYWLAKPPSGKTYLLDAPGFRGEDFGKIAKGGMLLGGAGIAAAATPAIGSAVAATMAAYPLLGAATAAATGAATLGTLREWAGGDKASPGEILGSAALAPIVGVAANTVGKVLGFNRVPPPSSVFADKLDSQLPAATDRVIEQARNIGIQDVTSASEALQPGARQIVNVTDAEAVAARQAAEDLHQIGRAHV